MSADKDGPSQWAPKPFRLVSEVSIPELISALNAVKPHISGSSYYLVQTLATMSVTERLRRISDSTVKALAANPYARDVLTQVLTFDERETLKEVAGAPINSSHRYTFDKLFMTRERQIIMQFFSRAFGQAQNMDSVCIMDLD